MSFVIRTRRAAVQFGPIGPELIEILACPVAECRGKLAQRESRLVCQRCGLRYAIVDGCPVLIPEEAEPPEPSADRS